MRALLAYICLLTIVASLDHVKLVEAKPDPSNDYMRCGGGYTYSQELDTCYKRYEPTNWRGAVAKCRLEDASLLVLETIKEANYIKSLEAASPQKLFLGIHDMVSEGNFMSIHGESMTVFEFQTFAKGEPNNGGKSEHCLGLYTDFTMNDYLCNESLHYYCEKRASPSII